MCLLRLLRLLRPFDQLYLECLVGPLLPWHLLRPLSLLHLWSLLHPLDQLFLECLVGQLRRLRPLRL